MSRSLVPAPGTAAAGAALPVSRRTLLKGAGLTALTLTGLTACGDDSGSASADGGDATSPVSLGSRLSDAVPKAAEQKVLDGFTAKTSTPVKVNTTDTNSFNEQITSYLQGSPDDVFGWSAGYRARFFAEKGLVGDVSDVWERVAPTMSEGYKQVASAADGKQYIIPWTTSIWATFYRKSLWSEKGYQVPATLDELVTLSRQMQKDGLEPIGFADKDGWPAMGTFDILNMRINGYAFHVSLMAGQERWDSPAVKEVFDTWRGLLPFHQADPLGRTWQEAAQSLGARKTGMYYFGSFVGQQFEGADYDDLDFFTFPEVNPEHGTDAIDAPTDGYMMAKKPVNEKGAKDLLAWFGSGEAQVLYLSTDPSIIASASDADTSGYNAVQKKTLELVSSSKDIAQFLDRDTRPDFASTVMIPALQDFIKKPEDVDGLTKSIQAQAETIFAS